ncbi:helix-turn-helix domain-containing protein [Metabacillus sp. HB246100]
MTKLSKIQAMAVIQFHEEGFSTRRIAETFKVSQRQIQKIIKGEAWSGAREDYVAHVKRMKKLEEIAPSTLYTGDEPPFEVVDFVHEHCNVTKRGVFINADAIHEGLLAEFTPTQLKSLLAILAHSNDTNTAYPSQQRIAKLTGMNVSTVNKNVQAFDGMQVACKYTGEVLAEDAVLRLKRPAVNNPYEMTIYKMATALVKHTEADFLIDNTAGRGM